MLKKPTAFWALMYFFRGLIGNLYLWLSFVKWQYGWEQVNSLLHPEQIKQGSISIPLPSTSLKCWVWSLIIFQNHLYHLHVTHQTLDAMAGQGFKIKNNLEIAFLVNCELVASNFLMSLKDYSKPTKQLHGKGEKYLINLNRNVTVFQLHCHRSWPA